jgi:hypothetical protein
MRDQAAGDEALLQAVTDLGADPSDLRSVGNAAIEQGNVLMAEARRLAQSIGEDLPE